MRSSEDSCALLPFCPSAFLFFLTYLETRATRIENTFRVSIWNLNRMTHWEFIIVEMSEVLSLVLEERSIKTTMLHAVTILWKISVYLKINSDRHPVALILYCIVLYCIVVGSRRLMSPDALHPKAYSTNPGLWLFLLASPGVSTRDPSSERRNYLSEKWPMNFAWKCPTST